MSDLNKTANVRPESESVEQKHTELSRFRENASAGSQRLISEGLAFAYTPQERPKSVGVIDTQKEAERLQLKKTIEDRFKISITEEGKFKDSSGRNILCRPAKKEELEALKQTLTKAEPAQMISPEKGATFIFEAGNRPEEIEKADVSYNQHGIIVITPVHSDQPDILERGEITENDIIHPTSVADIIRHEIAHTPDVKPPYKTGIFDDDLTGAESERYGYRRIKDVTNGGQSTWVQETKDGRFFKQSFNEKGPVWSQCDLNGRPILDRNGKLISINDEGLQKIAKVSSLSPYMDTPYEKKAEGIACLWKGGVARAYLYVHNRDLYDKCVQDDQKVIDSTKGKSNFIRNPLGGLMPDTQANRNKVKQFENNAPAMLKAWTDKQKAEGFA